jgi:AraC-like DNA-binding protein
MPIMKYLLLFGAFEAFTFALLLLFFKKQKFLPDKILALFFLLLSLTMSLAFMEGYNRENNYPYPFLLFTAPPFLLLHGPFLWFYIKSFTIREFRFKPIYLLHFLPFLAMLAEHSIDLFFLPAAEKIDIAYNEEFVHFLSYPVFMTLIVVSPLVYFSWGLLIIKNYNSHLKNYFSKLNDINLNWLRILLIASITFYFIVNGSFFVSLFKPFESFYEMQFMSFAFSTIYVLFLGLYGHKQVNLFANHSIPFDLEQIVPEPSSQKNLDESEKLFIENLLSSMEKEKPFLNPDVNLATLSSALKTSPDRLSNTLNNNLNMNFYDFINHYRIEEFKKECRLEKNKNYTFIAIAYNCGFNSKATFNRVFKNATGLTPKEFKQSLN